MDPTITIGYPAAGATVPATFKASGQINPPNIPATVTLNGTTIPTNEPGDGNWSATFQNVQPGIYTLQA